ncbi:MAG: hypothetical protein FWD53_02945, partial [Phycisphaerales bacterium]|nr:hypothetical protein [Phycisphaerales bacterium]
MTTNLFPLLSSIAMLFICFSSGCASPHFMGLPIEERHVIFILDCDLQGERSHERLRAHIAQTVQSLGEEQHFTVMLVGEMLWTSHPQLVPATNEIKQSFARQMAIPQVTISIGDRLPFEEAFTKAFALKPDAIYFLADPWAFHSRLTDTVAKLQNNHPSPTPKIHTLAFLEYRSL